MWFWAWKFYFYTLIDLCRIGITKTYDEAPGAAMVPSCWPFDTEKWTSQRPVGVVLEGISWKFNRLLKVDPTSTVPTQTLLSNLSFCERLAPGKT
jgi:hypothetical protein